MELSEKQERWIKQLEELWNFFDTRLENYSLKTNDLRFSLLLHMTVGAHRLIRGFLAQLKGGSNDFLESRLRTLVESSININYILADETGNRARAFVFDGTRSQLTALRKILRLLEQKKAPSMAEVNTIKSYKELQLRLEQEISERQRLFGKANLTWPPLEQRAEGGNSEELYATVFWLFSQDTHMTAEGLDRYLRITKDGIAMTTELDLSTLDQQIQTAYILYIAFINTCSQRFGFPSEEQLKEFNISEMLPKRY